MSYYRIVYIDRKTGLLKTMHIVDVSLNSILKEMKHLVGFDNIVSVYVNGVLNERD